jgi:hypothetical protein
MVTRFALIVATALAILVATTLFIGALLPIYQDFQPVARAIILVSGVMYYLSHRNNWLLGESVICFLVGIGGSMLFLATWHGDMTSIPVLFGVVFWLAGAVGSNLCGEMWLIQRRERSVHSAR